MENKCENCLHKGICKLEDKFKEYQEKIGRPVSDNFEIEVKCKKFLDKTPTLTYPEGVRTIKKEEYPNGDYWTTKLTSTHPCEGCPTYEKVKKGETVVGDGCYWCSKNPNKITCGDTPETISINNVGTCKDVK